MSLQVPVQCLRTSSSSLGDLWGPVCRSPFLSLSAAMFLCCQIGPLGPFWFYFGEGQGSCRPVPWAPSLGTVDTQVPCVEPFSLPCFPRAVIGSALAWNSLQVAAV